MQWQLAEAKNRFSEVINHALQEGPQVVSRRKDTVIILAQSEYQKLVGQQRSFKEFLLQGPSCKNLIHPRDTSPMRGVKL